MSKHKTTTGMFAVCAGLSHCHVSARPFLAPETDELVCSRRSAGNQQTGQPPVGTTFGQRGRQHLLPWVGLYRSTPRNLRLKSNCR